MKKSFNKKYLVAGLSGLAIAGFLGMQACSNKPQSQQGQGAMAIPVKVETVDEDLVSSQMQFPAHIVPLKETELRAEVSGYITHILVADGALVQSGQKLYEIDQTRYRATVDQAKASLSIAKANHERAERDLARYEALARQDAIARQILDNARTELQNSSAQLLAAQAAVTTAETNLERSVIRAPFAGMVGISQVRVGALVNAGSTLINTISSTSPIAVEFQANENDLQEIQALRNRPVQDSTISLEPGGLGEYGRFGSISTIDRAVNRNTGSITVRATFDNPDGLLRAGMSAVLRISRRSADKQLLIPYKAVTEQLGQSTVYVLGDSSRVEQRVIKTGIKTGENIVVRQGLSLGERIVTDGIVNLRNGATVQVTAPDSN